jgi:hypothetical protein
MVASRRQAREGRRRRRDSFDDGGDDGFFDPKSFAITARGKKVPQMERRVEYRANMALARTERREAHLPTDPKRLGRFTEDQMYAKNREIGRFTVLVKKALECRIRDINAKFHLASLRAGISYVKMWSPIFMSRTKRVSYARMAELEEIIRGVRELTSLGRRVIEVVSTALQKDMAPHAVVISVGRRMGWMTTEEGDYFSAWPEIDKEDKITPKALLIFAQVAGVVNWGIVRSSMFVRQAVGFGHVDRRHALDVYNRLSRQGVEKNPGPGSVLNGLWHRARLMWRSEPGGILQKDDSADWESPGLLLLPDTIYLSTGEIPRSHDETDLMVFGRHGDEVCCPRSNFMALTFDSSVEESDMVAKMGDDNVTTYKATRPSRWGPERAHIRGPADVRYVTVTEGQVCTCGKLRVRRSQDMLVSKVAILGICNIHLVSSDRADALTRSRAAHCLSQWGNLDMSDEVLRESRQLADGIVNMLVACKQENLRLRALGLADIRCMVTLSQEDLLSTMQAPTFKSGSSLAKHSLGLLLSELLSFESQGLMGNYFPVSEQIGAIRTMWRVLCVTVLVALCLTGIMVRWLSSVLLPAITSASSCLCQPDLARRSGLRGRTTQERENSSWHEATKNEAKWDWSTETFVQVSSRTKLTKRLKHLGQSIRTRTMSSMSWVHSLNPLRRFSSTGNALLKVGATLSGMLYCVRTCKVLWDTLISVHSNATIRGLMHRCLSNSWITYVVALMMSPLLCFVLWYLVLTLWIFLVLAFVLLYLVVSCLVLFGRRFRTVS